MARYFLEVSYDGTAYHGWQVQENAVTVQEKINGALSTLFRQPVETVGCGRTDTGVHASEFYAHFDEDGGQSTVESLPAGQGGPESFIRQLNALLPSDISVTRVLPVADNAHARFDATSRSYEYRIHFNKDPFKTAYSWQLRDRPDITLMNRAAEILKEYRDFSSFSKSNTQTFTNNCVVTEAVWKQVLGGITFHITADRFLRNMVRAIVGTLIDIGKGKMQPGDIRAVIESKSRSKAGTSVPACGLFLTRVIYPYLEPGNE